MFGIRVKQNRIKLGLREVANALVGITGIVWASWAIVTTAIFLPGVVAYLNNSFYVPIVGDSRWVLRGVSIFIVFTLVAACYLVIVFANKGWWYTKEERQIQKDEYIWIKNRIRGLVYKVMGRKTIVKAG